MRIFLDANILISVLNKEYPVYTFSARLLSLVDNKKYQLYTSPLCLAIAFYFAEKKSGSKEAKRKIDLLASKLLITALDKNTVEQALENKRVTDFEDGLQYYSAIASKCQYIVTEDKSDFHFSEIPVLNSEAFITGLLAKRI